MFRSSPQTIATIIILFVAGVTSLYFRGEFILVREKFNNTRYELEQSKHKSAQLENTIKLNRELTLKLNTQIDNLREKNELFQKEVEELTSNESSFYLSTSIPPDVRRVLERN